MKLLTTTAALCIGLLSATGIAHAATVNFDLNSNSASQGGQVAFNLLADFGTTPTLGGAIDFTWNSAVMTYSGFAFDAGLASPVRDTGFDVNDLQSAGLLSIGFGNLSGIMRAGSHTVGTLIFTMIGTAGSSTSITLSDSAKWAGFTDTRFNPTNITYSGATASVASVPLPAASWLMCSGLLGLVSLARRRTAV